MSLINLIMAWLFSLVCRRDQKLTGSQTKDAKLESSSATHGTDADQATQGTDKKAAGASTVPPGNKQRNVSVSSIAAVDGLDTTKTSLVPATTVR